MATCEKCWDDAYFLSRVTGQGQAFEYQNLVAQRGDEPCSPEEQCGKTHRPTVHLPGGRMQCICGKQITKEDQ